MEDPSFKCSITNTSFEPGSFARMVHNIIYTPYNEDADQRNALLLKNIFDLLNQTDNIPKAQKILELVQYKDGLIWEFEIHFNKWLESHNWTDPEFDFWINKWNSLGLQITITAEQPDIAESLYVTLYRLLRKYEKKYGPVSKGTALHQIGWVKFAKGAPKSRTYFLLALVEDILTEWRGKAAKNNYKINPAYRVLLVNFSETKEYLERFVEVIEEFTDLNKYKQPNVFYPEEVLTWYITTKKYRERMSQCFDFDAAHAAYLYEKITLSGSNPKRGRALEQLISYVLLSQTNFEVLCNLRGIKDETDLRLRNFNSIDPFINELGRYILVEAKNTQKPMVIQQVNDFITNVVTGNCNSGILVSISGVTGSKFNQNAQYAIRQIYHKQGTILLLLEKGDLEDIVKGANIFDLLLEKYENLRFDS